MIRHQQQNSVRLFRAGLLAAVVVVLPGCALTSEKTEDEVGSNQEIVQKTVQQSESKTAGKDKPEPVVSHMDSTTMFKVLAAEMMQRKGQSATAFEVLYPLAVQTRDKELAKRVFQISMSTYDLNSIEKATLLWREVSPESATAWRASFLLSLRNGKIDEGLGHWNTYYKLSELNFPSVVVSSATKVASTVPQEYGTEFFKRLAIKFEKEWSVHYGLGMVATVYKDPETGIPALDKAKQLMQEEDSEDNLALVYNLLSKLYLMGGSPETGIDKLRPYLEKNPDDLLVQERMARLEVQAKRYQEAEQRYQLITEAEPEAYTSLFSLALLQLERKAYDEAEKNLLKVSAKKGYQSVGQYYLGVLYQERENYPEAKRYFKQVKPGNYAVDAKLHLAEIHFAEKETEKAFELLDSMEPSKLKDKIKVLRAKAIFTAALKEYADAIVIYDQVLLLEPDNLEVLKAQSMLFYKSEDFVNYESNLLKVLKIDDNDSDALNALGYFYVEQKIKLDQAYLLLKKALEIEPDSYYILDSMGWYYYQVKDYDKALQHLQSAFDKAKDDEVLIHLISTYWQNGEINRAKSLWQEYHEKFKSNDRVQNLINELESESIK